MSSVNLFTREIAIKIVYYGPGLGGKTSSLQFIHRALKIDSRGQLVSLATGVDRTLYFDFLPVKLPKLRGYSIRVQLYTVPGQVHYNSTRKLVLAGADGMVFVADSQLDRDTANVESLENLRENLVEQGLRVDQVPLVFQYNKRDAPDVHTIEDMNARLNPHGAPVFETVATSGLGVFEALKAVTALVLNDLRKRGIWDGGGVEPQRAGAPPATGAGVPEAQRPDASNAQRIAALSEAVVAIENLQPAADEAPPELIAITPPPIPASAAVAAAAVSYAGAAPRPVAAPPSAGHVPSPGHAPSASNGSKPHVATARHAVVAARPSSMLSPLPTPRLGLGAGISDLVAIGPARDAAAAVEAEIGKGDYARAVQVAAHAFAEASKVESTSPEIAPVLHALMTGTGGRRYLRFCEAADRAEQGNASLDDALFALFFFVDANLER